MTVSSRFEATHPITQLILLNLSISFYQLRIKLSANLTFRPDLTATDSMVLSLNENFFSSFCKFHRNGHCFGQCTSNQLIATTIYETDTDTDTVSGARTEDSRVVSQLEIRFY